ncbi:MAG: ribosome silencing factor [Bacteroidales bacterium]
MKQQDNLIETIIDSIKDKKGNNIVCADLTEIEGSSVQNFVICSAKSTTQVTAIADNIREETQNALMIKPFGYDGYQNSQWIVIDYGYIYVHVFLQETREYYKLEQLWNDAKLVQIPNED